ncbi:MAG: FG-GAP-like repeat-containing protein [Opitutaceae bacterium]
MKTVSQRSALAFCAGILIAQHTLFAGASANLESTPFAARSGPGEGMGFSLIPPEVSGLRNENPYDDPRMWGALYTEFSAGAIGTGVAVADVDRDGWVDLYIVNKCRPNQLFRQVAPFRFEDVTAEAGVAGPVDDAWKTGATFADVNNDGFPDLYVCRFNAPNLLFLNDGNGVFTEAAAEAGLDLVSGSVVGAFEDYDRDGWLDVFVAANVLNATASPDGEVSHLYRNRGDGTFEDVSVPAGISRDPAHTHSANWFDANGDGWADLYIANDFSAPDFLYRNNGDGTFTEVTASALAHIPWFSMGSDAADINNDGLFDFIVADMAGTTHFKSKVTMGDMGGLVDYMDMLVTPQYMKNAVFVNSGTDRFWEVAKMTGMSSTDWTWSLRFEDLDNDGWVDLHVTNGMVRSFTNSDLLNVMKTLGSQEERAAVMKASPPLNETNLTFRNLGDLRFQKVQKEWGLDHTGVSYGSALADFDRDGDLDLVYTNVDAPVSLYRNDGAKGHSITIRLKGTSDNRFGMGAQAVIHTANGVQTRRLTVARGALSSSEPIMHFGLGDEGVVTQLEIHWPNGQIQTFHDLPAGHQYVITEPNDRPVEPAPAVESRPVTGGLFADQAKAIGIDFVNTERVFNDMVRQSLLPHRMNTLGGGMAWGDADGDGSADLFLAGAAGVAGALFLNDGNGHFARSPHAQPWDASTELEEMAAVWVDLNVDGALDLVVSSGSVEAEPGSDLYRSRVYLNDGQGRFSEVPAGGLKMPSFSAGVVTAADYDLDGDLDLFIGGRVVPGEYPTAPVSVLLENRDGNLVDVTSAICPQLERIGMVTAALWTDVDRDGRPDLLLAGEWMSLRLFLNQEPFLEATAEAGLDQVTGWWNSLAAADLNRDGAIDYIAGNVGLNTKYHASAEHPAQIYYVDFEGTGRPQIIEGKFEGENLYPVRGRSCSSLAMPSLKEKFPTFNEFASALLPEIYTPEKLDGSLHLSANELASGVFLNDGSGHFAFRPLPRMAQTAPVFGVVAADFTGDGQTDLFLAQNFNGPQVETGRYDGGLSLILVGDGTGGFVPMTPAQSGIAISGEGRAATLGDWNLDGWPDLMVTRTNEPVLALTHRGSVAAGSFSVALKGSTGNPSAVGARITAHFEDGSVESAEINSGSGYLSQSEPVVFFGYALANPPVSIDVNWPDGSESTHPFVRGVPRMVLSR